MRIETTTRKIYKLAELSAKAKAKAIDEHRSFLSEIWEADCTIDNAKDIGRLLGLDISKIYYSGFSSQGDGACFEGSFCAKDCKGEKAMIEELPLCKELHRIAKAFEVLAAKYPSLVFTVNHSGHYYHKNCTQFAIEFGLDGEEETKAFNDDESNIIEASKDFMEWIYKSLEEDYDYVTSEEQVIESIEANDYEFTEDGKPA